MASTLMDSPVQAVLARLKGVKPHGDSWVARCPAHADRNPSLSVSTGKDGRVLLCCHAGCTVNAIVASIGIAARDLFPADSPYAPPVRTNGNGNGKHGPEHVAEPVNHDRPVLVKSYDYTDEAGAVLFQACRFVKPDGSKTFRQRRPDGNGGWDWKLGDTRLVPYRLPEVIEAVSMGRRIFVVEGEKDADALAAEGVPATTNPMGAGKWRDEYSAHFKGADVVVLPDNDDVGRSHAETVAGSLTAAGARVWVVALPGVPEKGDVSDWLEAGGDFDELDELIGRTRIWTTDPLRRSRWRLDELLANDELMRPPKPVVPRLAFRARSTLLAAAPKTGKSTLIAFVAACVSCGRPFMDEPVDRGVVLLISPEEYIGDVARRLARFEADSSMIHVVHDLPADPRERPSALAGHVEAVKPDLVVIDTMLAYGRGLIEDENNAVQMQAVTQGLTDLAHRFEVALVIVHHATKATGKYRGSTAIGGGVDAVAELSIPDEDADPTRRAVKSVGRIPIYDFEYRMDGDLLAIANVTGAPLIQRVLDFIRSHPDCSLRQVRGAVGGRAEATDAAIQTLMLKGWIVDTGDRQQRQYRTTAYARGDVLKEWHQ